MSKFGKSFFLLVILRFSATNQQDATADFLKAQAEVESDCAAEQNITVADIKKVWASDEIPDDHRVKCAFDCIFMKNGVIDSAGDVVDEALEKVSLHFNNPTVNAQIVQQCKDIKDPDPCDAGYLLAKCITKVN